MKLYRILALVLGVLLCAALLVACNNEPDDPAPTPCETHTDADKNGICEVCGATVPVVCDTHVDANNDSRCDVCKKPIPVPKINYTVTVTDEAGEPLADISVTLFQDGEEIESLTSDENGEATGSVEAGSYMLVIEDLPQYWYTSSNYSTIRISSTANTFPVVAIDNSPDGTPEKPFPAEDAESGEADSRTFAAGVGYYYTTKGTSRYLVIQNANAKVIYNQTEYTPDTEDEIRILLDDSDVNENILFQVINTADTDNLITIGFEALPGTLGNPYEAVLDSDETITVVAGSSVYYTLIAPKTGVLVVKSLTETNDIILYNITTSVVASNTEGDVTRYLYVTQGDEIRIEVSTLLEEPSDSDSEPIEDEITFTLSVYEGTESDPIVFYDTCTLKFAAGKTYYFRYMGESGTISVSSADATFKVNGLGNATDSWSGLTIGENDTFYVTSQPAEQGEITVTVTPPTEQ